VPTNRSDRLRNTSAKERRKCASDSATRENTWGAEIIDELKPQEKDKVVGDKCKLCGFNKTNLGELLEKGHIKNVVIAGFLKFDTLISGYG
jgi:nicotinamidase-related amidase